MPRRTGVSLVWDAFATVDGPALVARTISMPRGKLDEWGNHWQYHSQSDRHSKAACWAVAFDLLRQSSLIRSHFGSEKVVFGVNHSMVDFKTDRRKKLDLVIARPAASPPVYTGVTLATLAQTWHMELTADEAEELEGLPEARVAPVGSVLVALEAKAAMTAHVKALPRLYDELNSSHITVHGASEQALAVGFVMVNASESFVSTSRNRHSLNTAPAVISADRQPASAERVIAKVKQISRRAGSGQGVGFDGLGIVVVRMKNDGSPVSIVTAPPAPQAGDSFSYDAMIGRIVHQYEVAFARI